MTALMNTRDALELKPCPFCGSQPTSRWHGVTSQDGEDEGYWGIDCCRAFAHEEDEATAAKIWNTRATPATDKTVEGIARIICNAKGVNPDCLHQNYSDDEPVDSTDAKGRTYHFGWRNQLHIANAILSAYPLRDEAAIRAEEREKCAQQFVAPVSGLELHRFIFSGRAATDTQGNELFIAKPDVERLMNDRAAAIREGAK